MLAASSVPALAAPPIVAADPTRPTALEITDASTYLVNGTYGLHDVVCVSFINHGPSLATKVGLSLALLDASGTVVDVETMYPGGRFPIGERSAFSAGRRNVDTPNGNCQMIGSWGGATNSSQFAFRAKKKAPSADVVAIVVSAREIVYQDGTAYSTDQVPHLGDHLELPAAPPFSLAVAAGPPIVSFAPARGAPIEITDAFALERVDQNRAPYGPLGSGLLGAINSIASIAGQGIVGRSRSYCMAFANRDPRDVRLVRVNLAILDRAGNVAGVETLDSKGPFGQSTDKNSGIACEGLRGKLDADTFLYKRPEGDPIAVGRIVIMPATVEFVDGTTWTAPNPPAIGAPFAVP
ncbi:MAG TPA: hypothetical protein VGN14_18215 [Candidatus Elarobacter sp.]